MAKLGQFGDTFGFLNTLFSGLALIGAVIALVFQVRLNEYERKHDREMMFRQKLEELLFRMYSYRGVAQRNFLEVSHGKLTAIQMDDMLSNLHQALTGALAIIRLYFPALEADFRKKCGTTKILEEAHHALSDAPEKVAKAAAAFHELIDASFEFIDKIATDQKNILLQAAL